MNNIEETNMVNTDKSNSTVGWFEKISSWWQRMKIKNQNDPEAPSLTATLVQKNAAVQPHSVPPSKVQAEIWLPVILFCLAASAGLLPYLGWSGLFKDPSFTDTYLWWVNLVFPIWWCLVLFGVYCILCRPSSVLSQYAWFSVCFGLLGLSVLLILFCHWMLAINATYILGFYLAVAVIAFSIGWSRGTE